MSDYINNDAIPNDVCCDFVRIFEESKKCIVTNIAILTCKNLIPFKNQLEENKDYFLIEHSGISFCPLPDLHVDFKHLYIDDTLSEDGKAMILTVLQKLFSIGHDVYEAVTSPDVDVNEFSELVMESIAEVRKKIPRCNEAFDIILKSVDMLKDNFNGYYKEYMSSGNPAIIMEQFVLDVSQNAKSSAVVAQQFRNIIKFYRSQMSQMQQTQQHQKINSLFKEMENNLTALEKDDTEPLNNEINADEIVGDGAGITTNESIPTPKTITQKKKKKNNKKKKAYHR